MKKKGWKIESHIFDSSCANTESPTPLTPTQRTADDTPTPLMLNALAHACTLCLQGLTPLHLPRTLRLPPAPNPPSLRLPRSGNRTAPKIGWGPASLCCFGISALHLYNYGPANRTVIEYSGLIRIWLPTNPLGCIDLVDTLEESYTLARKNRVVLVSRKSQIIHRGIQNCWVKFSGVT